MRRATAETFEIRAPIQGGRDELWPCGGRVVGVRLWGAEVVDPLAVGAIAIPGPDRFVGLLEEVPTSHAQPWAENRLARSRIEAYPDPIVGSLFELDEDAPEATAAWLDGGPDPGSRLSILLLVWRLVRDGGRAELEHRIGGWPDGRHRSAEIRDARLLGGRNLGGTLDGKRGAVNLSWITRIRLLGAA